MELLGELHIDNADVNAIRVQRIIYLPSHYVATFLGGYLSHIDAWKISRGAIINASVEDDFRPIIDCLQDYLTRNSGD